MLPDVVHAEVQVRTALCMQSAHQEKKGNLYLGALTVGAPAWKSKQLTEGDKILKVKSKPNQEPVNVVGMLSSEAVLLIRGEEGSPVTLTVEKKDKTIKEVTMVREEVAMEDTYAKSIIVNAPDGKKYGFINLPGFNAEFEKEKDKNSDGADGFRYTVGSQTVFPGKLPQYVSGNSDSVFVHGTCCIRSDTGGNDSGRTGDGDSDFYLFGRNTGRDQRILCKDSCVGYHFTYDKRFSYGGNWICTDRPV